MATTPSTLWGLHVSPWTEKARWALDHHQIRYRYREHVPMLGEPALRWRARKRPRGRPATVPVFIDDLGVFCHSDDIARHAEAIGKGKPLFPGAHDNAIVAWCEAGDRALQAARGLITAGLAASPEAQIEALPPFIPALLRRPLRGIAAQAAGFIAHKYGADDGARARREAELDDFCQRLRAALDGRDHLLGDDFSYADIACAVVIHGFAPPTQLFARLPANKAAWTQPALAERHADLIAWRDRLYQDHRPRAG